MRTNRETKAKSKVSIWQTKAWDLRKEGIKSRLDRKQVRKDEKNQTKKEKS